MLTNNITITLPIFHGKSVICIKCLNCIDVRSLGRQNVKDFNDRLLPRVPIKHARGQTNVFPNHITVDVLPYCSFMSKQF